MTQLTSCKIFMKLYTQLSCAQGEVQTACGNWGKAHGPF